MDVILDRFEGESAIIEIDKGKFVSIPKILVADAKEGDVITILVNKAKTENRKKEIENLMNSLFID